MPIELVPGGDAPARAAVAAALTAACVELGPVATQYRSAWRLAALAESVERGGTEPAPGDDRYALSPRSTRGAMRA